MSALIAMSVAAERRGPFGPVGEDDLPLCDQCEVQMQPYAGQDGQEQWREGYSCAKCGWFFDASLSASTVFPDYRKTEPGAGNQEPGP